MITVYNMDVMKALKQMPDESVDMQITSPPYWGLRDYGVEGQLGLEKYFNDYIKRMCDIFDEVKRVLKKDGTCWVNLGDTFSGRHDMGDCKPEALGLQKNIFKDFPINLKRSGKPDPKLPARVRAREMVNTSTIQPKCLTMIPERFALAMVQGIYSGKIIKEETNASWLAGIIDGEGCIGIYKSHNYYGLRISILSQDKELIEKIIGITNFGTVGITKIDNKDYYNWKCQGVTASKVICDIYPFLTIKKKQAMIGWNFYLLQQKKEMNFEKGKKYGNENGRPKLAKHLHKKREEFADIISKLNKRKEVDFKKLDLKEPKKSKVGGGWILRNVIIWHKPNHMPTPVKDRFANSWEYLFMFSKSKKYYFDLDAVREPHQVCGVTDKRPMGVIRQKLYPNSSYHKSNDQNLKQFQLNEKPDNKGKLGKHRELMKDSGYINQHSGYMIAGLKLKSEQGLDIRNPKGKNPDDIIKTNYAVAVRNKEFIAYRNLPNLKEFAKYINNVRKQASLTIEQVEEEFKNQAPHHWFNAESFPSKEDYLKLKNLIKLDSRYDKQLTEIFTKLSEKQNNLIGKNPDDIVEAKNWRQGMNRDETELIKFRPYLPRQNELVAYLIYYIKKEHEEILDKTFGEHKWRHWIRKDKSGFSFPNREDWFILKQILKFDNTYDKDMTYEELKSNKVMNSEAGKNPSDFWDITTHGYKEAHFAVFPEKLVERPIKTTPKYICKKCEKPRERITENEFVKTANAKPSKIGDANRNPEERTDLPANRGYTLHHTKGWTDCKCNVGFRPAVILDIFAGSGTTLKVARDLHRDSIGIEIKPEYCDLIYKRLFGENQQTLVPSFKLIKQEKRN